MYIRHLFILFDEQNKWVDHMCLNEADNSSDPEGIQVRAMQGYEGVSYLADGIAKNMTYVRLRCYFLL
jgi:hypothetical protein